MTAAPYPIVILGPTASGKSAYAHGLCQWLRQGGQPSQVVNLDAFQFYRGMSIGTAKPTDQEQKNFGYLGVDILDPLDRCDAQTYSRWAWEWCHGLSAQGVIPIAVGGSGLYTRAFLHGLDDLPPQDPTLRAHLRQRAQKEGWPALHKELETLNPLRAAQLHPNDGVRIERALELALGGHNTTGHRHGLLKDQPLVAPCVVVQLRPHRPWLKDRIALRVGHMLEQGWAQEVALLWRRWGPPLLEAGSFRAIGYKTLLEKVVIGGQSADSLYQTLSQQTWAYARRQATWNAQEVCHFAVEGESCGQGPTDGQGQWLLNRVLGV